MTLQHPVDLGMNGDGDVCRLRRQNYSWPVEAARSP
jgi:hypothetical protein